MPLNEIRDIIVALDVVGSRVWQLRLPQLNQLPSVTYHQYGSEHDYLIDGPLGRATLSLQIDIWCKSLSQAKTINESIRLALSGYSSQAIDVMLLRNTHQLYELEEGSDQSLYHLVQQYEVIYSESI